MFPKLITELLQGGYKVNFSAPGHSMYPTIMPSETILVEPIDPGTVKMGDIILYQTDGRLIAHRLIGIDLLTSNSTLSHSNFEPQSSVLSPDRFFIFRGDACPSCDKPVEANQILGKVVSIERNGRCINPYSLAHKLSCQARWWVNRIMRWLACTNRRLSS